MLLSGSVIWFGELYRFSPNALNLAANSSSLVFVKFGITKAWLSDDSLCCLSYITVPFVTALKNSSYVLYSFESRLS